MTSSLLDSSSLKPRGQTAQTLDLFRPTWKPGTARIASATVVAPMRRRSSSRKNRDRGGHVVQRLFLFGSAGDVDLEEVVEIDVGDVAAAFLDRVLRPGGEGRERSAGGRRARRGSALEGNEERRRDPIGISDLRGTHPVRLPLQTGFATRETRFHGRPPPPGRVRKYSGSPELPP